MLRQDPVECLFEFICSSNNHISRIHGMVERLCRDYGAPLLHRSSQQTASLADADQASTDASVQGEALQSVPDLAFYAFPTLEQLSAASESALRAEGFGYRYQKVLLLDMRSPCHATRCQSANVLLMLCFAKLAISTQLQGNPCV